MAVDLSVFDKQKSIFDMQKLQQAFDMQKQLQQAQIKSLNQKANYLDVDKLGEQALFKAAAGVQLSPAETAAARYADAKTGGIQFDPVTGAIGQKPSIASRLGVSLGGSQAPQMQAPQAQGGTADMGDMFASPEPQTDAFSSMGLDPNNQYDQSFMRQYDASTGNPRLQQTLKSDYFKSKYQMNENQSKAATFADRAALAEETLNNPKAADAYANPWERFKDRATPFDNIIGNPFNSDDYNSFNQAQKNFETAKLRQESGATINDSEFKTDEQIFLPRASDPPELREAKKINREAVRKGLQRQAGPAYQNPATAKTVVKTQTNNATGQKRVVYSDGTFEIVE